MLYYDAEAEWCDIPVPWTKAEDAMAGASIWYDKGNFHIGYTAGSPPGTSLQLQWGTQSGMYPNVKEYPPQSVVIPVSSVLPTGSGGQFYARLVERIGVDDGVASPEVPFVVAVKVPAILTFEVR